jgi:ribosomal protein S27E
MKGDTMPQDDVLNEDTREQELYAVSCIHCGKTTFKFSRNTLYFQGGREKIELVCPRCGQITVYSNDGRIEVG